MTGTTTDVRATAPQLSNRGHSVVRAKGLTKSFGGSVVLRDVSLELHAGEIVLLRGANGSGKTTLINVLAGGLEPDSGEMMFEFNGVATHFRFPGPWWQRFKPTEQFTPERVARLGLGRSWQDLRLFESQNLRDNIALAALGQPGERPARSLLQPKLVRHSETLNRQGADNVLMALGLSGRETSSADQISLGQAKRVAIARAIHGGAHALLLDEPLSGLDQNGVVQVLELIRDLAHRSNVAVLIVEHAMHMPRLLTIVERVWTLKDGRLVDESRSEALAHEDPEEEALASSQLEGSTTRHLSLSNGVHLSISPLLGAESGGSILRVENLVVLRGARAVLGPDQLGNPLSFELRGGDLAILRAPNGWGKTTLLEALAGLLPITSGRVEICGQEIGSLPTWKRRRLGLALLRARASTFPNLTVSEALNLTPFPVPPEQIRVPLHSRIGDLSGGQKQRFALATTMSDSQVSLRLFDEPFATLDASGIAFARSCLVPNANSATLIAEPGIHNHSTPW